MRKKSKFANTVKSLIYLPSIILKLARTKTRYFFIFPSWQIGGGERVHADILGIFKSYKPLCVITNVQFEEGLKIEFEGNASVLYLWRWGTKSSFRNIMLKLVSKFINRNPHAFVFGSNNLFFYDLIPYLAPHVKIIDLTHSITPKQDWCEIISLKLVDRFYKRILLGNNALDEFKQIYAAHYIPAKYVQHFQIIKNKVDIPTEMPIKDYSGNLEVIFVARNSPEKRAELFFEIARLSKKRQVQANFTIIGSFQQNYHRYSDVVHFAGSLNNKTILSNYYKTAHLILITSTFEGFPMVLLESMAYGVVPISTAVGEIPFYVSEEKQTGFLIKENSEHELVEQFVGAIEKCTKNTELLTYFGVRARKLVEGNFSSQQFITAYKELFDVGFGESIILDQKE